MNRREFLATTGALAATVRLNAGTVRLKADAALLTQTSLNGVLAPSFRAVFFYVGASGSPSKNSALNFRPSSRKPT